MQLINRGTKVTALFFYHGVKGEIREWRNIGQQSDLAEEQRVLRKCKISISKYAKAVLLCNSFMRSNSSFEIRIVGDLTEDEQKEMTKETFALIRLKSTYFQLFVVTFVSGFL